MTTTSALIDQLAGDLSATPQGLVARRVGLGVAVGAVIAAAVALALWGVRVDMTVAVASWPFWTKLAYPAALALLGLIAMLRLARPDAHIPRGMWGGMVLVPLVMAGLAATELGRVAPEAYGRVIMGSSSAVCPWLIALLAMPVMASTLWMLRQMAPTRLTLAGAVAGLTAGATAALIYGFTCDERALPFVLVWYGLGMALPTLAGALLGRFALRW